MIERRSAADEVRRGLRRSPVVAIVGPRQSGKTTLARSLVPGDSGNYFDLENPAALARLAQPMTALEGLRGTVVVDEVQRRPDLFPVLRVLADRRPLRARFLVLGSASPELLRQSSESLAGRIETIVLGGFSLEEIGAVAMDKHWRRGGFPRAFLARTEADSIAWRREFIRTFLERDLPQLGVAIPSDAMLRFWTMLAHYHGNIWNAADPARSLGVREPTVRRYLDILSSFFVVRQLPPWHENLGKRQVKAPKIYVRDSGLLHQLLGIQTPGQLLMHPKCGASWEGYALEEVLKRVRPDHAYFWSTYQGAELDLLLFKGGRRLGIEMKRMDAPVVTKSMKIAIEDLGLEHLTVVVPGGRPYELDEKISVRPLAVLAEGGPDALFPKRARRRRDAAETFGTIDFDPAWDYKRARRPRPRRV